MAERVVELLEAVEVDEQQRELAAVRVSIAASQAVEQVAAVAEAGEVVGDERCSLSRRRSTTVIPARAIPVRR